MQKKSYIMWFILALAYIIAYFHRVSLAVVLDYLVLDFKITDAALAGTLASMYAIIYMPMQIPAGFFADFWGPRKTAFTGMTVAGVGSIIFALAPRPFLSFIGRGMVGLGVSVLMVSVLKFQASWFKPAQFATMTGLLLFAGNLGGLMGTTPLAFLVLNLGWRNAFCIIGIVSFIIALLCWLIVRDAPANMALSSSMQKNKKDKNIVKREFVTALKNVLKNPYTWPPLMATFGVYGTLIAFSGTWSISYLMQVYSFTRTESANYMLALALGMILGCPIIGYLSDKTARRKMPHLIFFAVYIALWGLLFIWNEGKPPSAALYYIFFFMGLSGATVTTIFASAKEVNHSAYSGLATGIVNMGSFTGIAIMQPLLGYILDLKWEGEMVFGTKFYPLSAYRSIFAAVLFINIICFVFALKIKETKCQNIFVIAASQQASARE
ncbi:MAG: MFS transporter [Bacillota bacterium]